MNQYTKDINLGLESTLTNFVRDVDNQNIYLLDEDSLERLALLSSETEDLLAPTLAKKGNLKYLRNLVAFLNGRSMSSWETLKQAFEKLGQ